jgi:hypothetical protein
MCPLEFRCYASLAPTQSQQVLLLRHHQGLIVLQLVSDSPTSQQVPGEGSASQLQPARAFRQGIYHILRREAKQQARNPWSPLVDSTGDAVE